MIDMDVNTCFATTEAYRSLALYSHLVPAAATIILGIFAFLRAQNRLKAEIFFAFSLAFATWLAGDLIVWISNPYDIVAAFWAPLDLAEIAFFLLIFAFAASDILGKPLSRSYNIFILLSASIPLYLTLAGQSVYELNQPVCEMLNNRFLEEYKIYLELLLFIVVSYLGLKNFFRAKEIADRIRLAMITISVALFMAVFGVTEYIANTTYVYEVHLYALFTLPIFILMLTIAITSYGAFRLGDYAVKALFYVFLALAGTMFFFVDSFLNFLLAGMSFGVVLTLGIMLFRSNEREIAARHLIEKQEKELEVVNAQQENLLHFISHEVKGYLTKSEAGFAAIAEGDYGAVSDPLKNMVKIALADTKKGVATVMDILDASNLKKGTVKYEKKPFNFCAAVEDTVNAQKKVADEKGISLEYTNSIDGECLVTGDEAKIKQHVVANVLDNSIKYTPSGNIHAELSKKDSTVRLVITDTGIGITPEDMQKLFKEGGHGAESIKTNVHSTGYGLFIAKSIVEAHGGKIWADSEGRGKGSKFTVELPASN